MEIEPTGNLGTVARCRCPLISTLPARWLIHTFGIVAFLLIQLPGLAATRREKEPSKSELEFFERKIRPIFTEHCHSCHSRSAEKLKSGLYLDSRDGLMKGGENGVIVVPGNADSSRLIMAVRHSDADFKMPPKAPLNPDQIADLEAWVKAGAAFPDTKSIAGESGPRSLDDVRSQWPHS